MAEPPLDGTGWTPERTPERAAKRAAQASAPAWARRWLQAAAIYNIAWGAWVVLWPGSIFTWLGLAPPNYPQIWQCVGMIVGVYGIGYLIAAADPRVHWPIVLVGLLGKLLGPLGFLWGALTDELPWRFGLTLLSNDLLWWVPFTMILWDAARSRGALPGGARPSLDEMLDRLRDQHGLSLREIAAEGPVMLLLLRHTGCTFCRQLLAELARRGGAPRGVHLALVTMSSPEENAAMAARLTRTSASRPGEGHREALPESTSWISDPQRIAAQALAVPRGSALQLFGPRVWRPGALALLRGHGVGALDGDGFQLAGGALLDRGSVVRTWRASSAADQPDLEELGCPIAHS
jgi:hypothetical protein